MNDVPQPKLYITPQERWFKMGATPDVFPEYGDKTSEYFVIRPFSEAQLGVHSRDAKLIEEQNRLRRDRGFEPFAFIQNEGLKIASNLNLGSAEIIALRLQELDSNGMTKKDPEFVIGTWDKKEQKVTDTRDITAELYAFYENPGEGRPVQPTYRDERRSLTNSEGNMTGGPENKG